MNVVEKDIIRILDKNNLLQISEIDEENYVKKVSEVALQIDSLIYISLLVEIEDMYNIELEETTLVGNVFENIHSFSLEIMDIIKIKMKRTEVIHYEENS